MSEFIQLFSQNGNLSFMGMRAVAQALLPKDRVEQDKLYENLDRGKNILDDDDHLNMYLYSYGKMHKAKLDTAFKLIPDFELLLNEDFEIYDWGCGQGTATICFLDYLASNQASQRIQSINLIEPSKAAVQRASDVISCINQAHTIRTVVKDFDRLSVDDFEKSNIRKIHLFSNILDVEGFDLARFIHLFQNTFNANNIFICIGPYYANSRRVREFMVATEPDTVFANLDKDRGEWQQDWTISLRLFDKTFKRVETIDDIRRRIEESHKKDQFFAGYVLDAIAEEYEKSSYSEESGELYRALSTFDVKSNTQLGVYEEYDSQLAVLANIISRGLPTKAPIFVENTFSDLLGVSKKPSDGALLNYSSRHSISAQHIYEALHIIDPRFDISHYNKELLESSFEREFISCLQKNGENRFLLQMLEPQRSLSSIIDIPNKTFQKEQRVDFALNIPYGGAHVGFIVEIDGHPYHSNILDILRDRRRDRASSQSGWDTYRITEIKDNSFLDSWRQDALSEKYLRVVAQNSTKKLSGKWNETLQAVLSPLAIARLERILVEALMTGSLNKSAPEWNIAVVERDVPCAVIAIKDLEDKIKHIYALSGDNSSFPKINLSVISTDEFAKSPLHLKQKVGIEMPHKHFDVCIDISMLLRDNIDALPLNIDAEAIYIVRSAHYQKRNRRICSAECIQYPPLVTKDSTGKYINIVEREQILTYFLRDIFRKPFFRTGQLPIISHSLGDQTTIGLLPTGGGKSLTYQISCMLQPGVSIIVDPLISLMVDQARGLRDLRIDVCEYVNSSMSSSERSEKLNLLQQGAVLFMLLSPERFMMPNFRENLVAMTEKNQVYFTYGIIDEVHCVSEWGHDFRTSYLHLGRNMINFMRTKSNRPLSIIGLTATASFDVLADVERELTLGGNIKIDSEAIVRPESEFRPELTYRVLPITVNFDRLKDPTEPYLLIPGLDELALKDAVAEEKIKQILFLLDSVPLDLEEKNEQNPEYKIPNYYKDEFYSPNNEGKYNYAGIIFCPHAKGVFGVNNNATNTRNGVSTVLMSQGNRFRVGTFVGGDHPAGDMSSFNNNDKNLMVATKAFGMGIDKPNIRFTINLNHPSSIESYVQEAGRGGRDKKNAISYLLYESTEYIHLTLDKINDIRFYMGKDDPSWMERYKDRYILKDNFAEFCRAKGTTEEQVQKIIEFAHKNGYLENVDKNIDLWFHNNSFRGLQKEKVILYELTDKILNAKPTKLTEVQGKLRELIGDDDLYLKVDKKNNSLTISSEEDKRKRYGYVNLENLHPSYRYIDFEYSVCEGVTNDLISILQTYSDYSAKELLSVLSDQDNAEGGIYQAMSQVGESDYTYVVVSWVNQIQQNPLEFENLLKTEITRIAQEKNWDDINESRYGCLNLAGLGDFTDLMSRIARCSNDSRWLRSHGDFRLYSQLQNIFSRKRDKDDTDKAIYRLCCIGIVEDVTIDYLSETYTLKVRNRSEEEFKQYMLEFFKKYYSAEQAAKRVAEIDNQKGRNYLDKCLGYLTAFVYTNLEKKRYRAIEDIRIACEDSIADRAHSGNDERLKEFIHLYFNSKYARKGYMVEVQNCSLMEDVDEAGLDGFEVVEKYIGLMNKDSSGSEVDNVKHLYGATLICLRAYPENAALQLLLVYCATFLGVGNNEILKTTIYNNYIEGFMSLYDKEGDNMWGILDKFNTYLTSKVHDDYIQEEILDKGKEAVLLFIHEAIFNNITKRYLGK